MRTELSRLKKVLFFIGVVSIAGCDTSIKPVTPESVSVAVNVDPSDPLWALFEAEFALAEIHGEKNPQGELEAISRVIARSKRDGRGFFAEFDDAQQVEFLGDDLGNVARFTYSDSDVRIDYSTAQGGSGTFTVAKADIPGPPGRAKYWELGKPNSPALAIPIPESVRVIVAVTKNGALTNKAFVTMSVDYIDSPVGTYFHTAGDYANKYFTYFVNRRHAKTAAFDDCVESTTVLNQILTIAGGALYVSLKTCAAVAGPTPTGGVCGFLSGALVTFVEAGIVSLGVSTAFPNHICRDHAIPQDPAMASITVHATLQNLAQEETRVVDLRSLPDPRELHFSFNFNIADETDCAPNGTFDVVDFDNGLDEPLDEPYICVSGDASELVFAWNEMITDVTEIRLRDGTLNSNVWAISVSNAISDQFSPPVHYGVTPTNVAAIALVPPQPLIPGRIYELTLFNPSGDPEIRFIIR